MKKGFTLVEILVAVALFGIAGTIAANIIIDVVRLEKRSDIHNTLYRDASVLMRQVADEIRNGTVDYEEYYSIKVVQRNEADGKIHGINHGIYGSRFYDPGMRVDGSFGTNPRHLGVECSEPEGASMDDCNIVYTPSFDMNTGQNPWEGSGENAEDANAFCDGILNMNDCAAMENFEADELYLIDESGTRKTVIAKQSYNGQKRLGIVRMTGMDFDQNGIIDIFSCDPGFDCTSVDHADIGVGKIPYPGWNTKIDPSSITLPKQGDSKAFIPLSPARAEVENIVFIIRPLEDPYRAYAEPEMQKHPSVTIVLTLDLSEEAKKEYPGEFTPITVQTTVSAGSRERIESYPPVTEFRTNNDPSWIKTALN